MRAEIYLEDAIPGPGIDVRFVYPDGYQRLSGAHQMSNKVRQILDAMVADGVLTALTDRETQGDLTAMDEDMAAMVVPAVLDK